MKLDNKETQFKKILEQPNQVVNIDELWSNIESELPRKESKKRGIVWWLSASFLFSVVAISILGIFREASPEPDIENQPQTMEASRDIAKIKHEEPKDEATHFNHEKVEAHPNTKSNQPTNNYSSTREKKNLIGDGDNSLSASTPASRNGSSSALQTDKLNESKTAGNYAHAEDSVLESTKKIDPSTHADRPILIGASSVPPSLTDLQYDYSASLIPPSRIHPIKTGHHRSISILQGLNRGRTDIVGHGENSDKAASINQREKDMIGYSGGIEISQYLNPRWRINLGINYNMQATRYRQQDVQFSQQNEEGLKEYVIGVNGDISSVLGEVETSSTTYNDITWHRIDHQVDLMMSVGFRVLRKSSFSLWIDGGASYNIWNKTSGYDYGGPDVLQFRKLTGLESTDHLGNRGFKSFLAPSLGYNYKSWEYFLRLNYTHFHFSPERENSIYNIKNSQTGIQLGICYHLNGN